MDIYHTHHIQPKHMGGTNNPENLIKLTIPEHAAWHYELWVYYGYIGDWVAWKMLSGQADDPEVWLTKSKLGGAAARKKLKGTKNIKHSVRMTGSNHPLWKGGKVSKICQCGKEYFVWPYKFDKKTFCSLQCRYDNQRESNKGSNNFRLRFGKI